MTTTPAQSAGDLRAAIARARVRLYVLGPLVGVHPATLGAMLSGRKPLTPDLAHKVERALTEVTAKEPKAQRGDA